KAVILIDEYDVPLENAYFRGFYDRMTDFIRSLFESALKTNDALQFAVITGCLRISKESIFTGLNNLKVISILDPDYAEYFGFTQEEVQVMLKAYGLEDRTEEVKKWYDGYLFGETEIYNPWSIVRCVDDNKNRTWFTPKAYWANTSSNSIVREMVEYADFNARAEIERLIAGEGIEKPIQEDITYGDLHGSQDNIWSFLFFTGYLKKTAERFENRKLYLRLTVPNEEVLSIYENTISQWFEGKVKGLDRSALLCAIENRDCETFGNFVSEQLQDSISYFDFAENYYHGFMVGLLSGMGRYRVYSNRESGDGRPDIVMQALSVRGRAFLFELKVAREFSQMEEKCREALAQAAEKNYKAELIRIGYSDITVYGVCFYRKECMVLKEAGSSSLMMPTR
ncbi:MAG: ATP-binding protein, partial [Lachnospiraceae bacterium]|nr:ATP-binding protein [Lachnospiraceae bacterium]